MKVLADTSVWVSHFRGETGGLAVLLESGAVVMHPWIRLEVALGTPPRRAQTLAWMAQLESLAVATDDELGSFIERRALHDRGIGLVDAALMAAVLLRPDVRLWSFDRALARLATQLGRAHVA